MFTSICLVSTIDELKEKVDDKSHYLILCAEGFDFEGIDACIPSYWLGAVFPGVFSGNRLYEDSALVCKLSETTSSLWLDSEDTVDMETLDDGDKSYIVIVDGLSSTVTENLENVYDNTAQNTIMFGGGAGCIVSRESAYMYNGENYTQEGMILIGSAKKTNIGINHGYTSAEIYSMVTRAENNKVIHIDGKEAFYFYKNYIKEHFDMDVTSENLFEIGLKHPFMLECTSGEKIVRVPMSTDGSSLVMVGEVLGDTIISIGSVDEDALLSATNYAAENAMDGFESKPKLGIVFTCVGREKISRNNFQRELDSIAEKMSGVDIVGVLSMGEIANQSTGNIEFYNCTCVVGVE